MYDDNLLEECRKHMIMASYERVNDMPETTMKIDSETLRQLKLRKTVLDFDNYDELILYILKFAPNDYVKDAAHRTPPPKPQTRK